jgi:AcrR family transcriptional regulator
MKTKRPVRKRHPTQRSNIERSIATRTKLITAAIDCIRRNGLAATSTTLVASEAGVSRGAMLHQFPQMADLLLAVAEYVIDIRTAERARRLAGMSARERFIATADVTWEMENQPDAIVLREILSATVGDRHLRQRLAPMVQRMAQLRRVGAERLAEELGATDMEKIYALVEMHMATLQGLAMERTIGQDITYIEKARALFTELERSFAEQLIAQPGVFQQKKP